MPTLVRDILGSACLLMACQPIGARAADTVPSGPQAQASEREEPMYTESSAVSQDAPSPDSLAENQPSEPPPDEPVSEQDADADTIDISDDSGMEHTGTSNRKTFAHEVSVLTGGGGLVNNRTSARLEYSTFFRESFFAQIDTKLNLFWSNDHRARDGSIDTEVITSEAFLQYSRRGGTTSVKAGVQKLIWGESEGGAITDEVSPRNFSELFLIPLEESRLGQAMLVVDHFSGIGDWSFFYVPKPRFNKYPERGTEYYVDPFAGSATIRDAVSGSDDEFGMRWRKTFGQSDISLMAARLIDNDYALRAEGVTPTGNPLLGRHRQRLTLTGATFSHTRGNALIKGEIAFKSPRAFNDAEFGIVEKDVLDSAIGITYSLGKSNTLGIEWVNSRILGWSDRIVGVPENNASLVVNANFFFFNDNLSINWLTIYSEPYASYQSSVRAAYKWDDNLSFGADLHYAEAPDSRSGLRPYRDKDQLVVRVQYQF